ncbi:SMI1/KNR4 family protein [Streptomyces sp. F001]|uniref:SMI1/KNR4 family protein n=1 Tax=Streptomyces sp. F001 TaxID=1510026 RepID=UPI00101E67DC|nr:SMI1/KNR4 family protein [Streptomyces sp. F001]RZB13558.1 SMI1/KNR4 family protein [Streptomyces sp. F001]
MWVQRVIELTGWEPLGISVDWAAIEGEPGVPLPADYKELYETFGGASSIFWGATRASRSTS